MAHMKTFGIKFIDEKNCITSRITLLTKQEHC